MNRKHLSVIGAGPGDPALLTQAARERLLASDEVYALNRIGKLMVTLRPDIREAGLSELVALLRSSAKQEIAVLVSGDVGFFSAAKSLLRDLSEEMDVSLYSGISSLQALCARLGVGYETVKTVSLHGREANILGAVAYHPVTFVLTGGIHKAHEICAHLTQAGLGSVSVTAGENLSMPQERILSATAEELSRIQFSDLTVLLIQNPSFTQACQPLRDRDFTRGKVPMTKEEIRWIALSQLELSPEHILWDVGAGTGSVAIEAARRVSDGIVYAVEREEDAFALIEENRNRLGAYNMVPIQGSAPEALETLPSPDRLFIGGSGGNLEGILHIALAKNPHVRTTVAAITLETLHEAVEVLEEAGMSPEVVCVNAARSKKAGRYHMMTANNPVYLITGERASEDGEPNRN